MTIKKTSSTKPATVKKVSAKKPLTPAKRQSAIGTAKKSIAQTTTASNKKVSEPLKKNKTKKIKMVRDSFSMTESDYATLIELKKKCIAAGIKVKKSELLRVGVMGLSKLSNASLMNAVNQLVTKK
jgi:DNA-binding transcriptional regulator YiaG